MLQGKNRLDLRKITETSAAFFARQIPKFAELEGELPEDMRERLVFIPDLKSFLLMGEYFYHKACYDRYNEQSYERAMKRNTKLLANKRDDEQSAISDRTRKKTGEIIPLGMEICLYCNEPDKFDKKHPDRTACLKLRVAAGKSVSHQHVLAFTNELRMMATKLQDTRILALLHTSDVRALELYYHLGCHSHYCRRFVFFAVYLDNDCTFFI